MSKTERSKGQRGRRVAAYQLPGHQRMRVGGQQSGSAMTVQQPSAKKPKQPLDYILRQMHDAMEMVLAYDHDPNFVPDADEIVLLEMIQKEFAGYAAMAHIIVATLRQRAMEASEVQHASTPRP